MNKRVAGCEVRDFLLGHNSEILVQLGTHVEAGEQVALSGSTGTSTGPHVHWAEHGPGPIWNPGGNGVNRDNLVNPLP